jgi:hypothetical protein
MKLGRAGVRLAELMLVVVTLTAALLASEMALRAIDGYELWSIRLVRQSTVAIQNRAAGRHAAQIPLAVGMDRAWLNLSPPPVPRKPVNPVFARIDTRYADTRLTFELFHVFNSSYAAQQMCTAYYRRFPGFFFIFDPLGGTEHPRYRFPLNEVTPIGLVTNQFGWRGPPIELRKAPNTIRIAFVGASTTVNNHGFPFSYPELAGFFLDKWAQARFGVRVEIINAGREGITSTDIAAVVRVASEMALHVLAYNMTRVMSIIGVRPLLAAVRA